MFCGTARNQTKRHIVLPDSKLIGCKASDCSHLWQDASADGVPIYPQNLNIDIENGAVLGIVAHYEKSVSTDELRDAINGRYAKWIFIDPKNLPVWRVEPERIAIQLSVEDNGMKEVIYLSANARRKRSAP